MGATGGRRRQFKDVAVQVANHGHGIVEERRHAGFPASFLPEAVAGLVGRLQNNVVPDSPVTRLSCPLIGDTVDFAAAIVGKDGA